MSETIPRFSCEACGKTYKWKFELAGRKVKCACGHVMRAPDEPPAPGEEAPLIPLADESDRETRFRAPAAAPAVEHEALHTVQGHQLMASTALGSPALTEHDPAPPPAAAPAPKSRPAPAAAAHAPHAHGDHPPAQKHRSVHVNAGQLLGSHIHHEEKSKPSQAKVFAMIGTLVVVLAVLAYMMLR